MRKLFTFQAWACAILLVILLGAEGAAFLLERFPSSAVLWQLNMDVFGPIQQASYRHSPVHTVLGPLTGLFALALLVASAWFARAQRRFATACVSHVCLIIAAGVESGWRELRSPLPETAALGPVWIGASSVTQPDLVVAVSLAAAVAAAVAAHLTFLLQFRPESRKVL